MSNISVAPVYFNLTHDLKAVTKRLGRWNARQATVQAARLIHRKLTGSSSRAMAGRQQQDSSNI
jgi:hypothetical protein